MKALSIKNPFAALILAGVKKYEVRSWQTYYRGEILICSTQKPENDLWKYYNEATFGFDVISNFHKFKGKDIPDGYAIATANLVDIKPFDQSTPLQNAFSCTQLEAVKKNFGDKPYYLWVLKNVNKIDPFPVKGKHGLFKVDF